MKLKTKGRSRTIEFTDPAQEAQLMQQEPPPLMPREEAEKLINKYAGRDDFFTILWQKIFLPTIIMGAYDPRYKAQADVAINMGRGMNMLRTAGIHFHEGNKTQNNFFNKSEAELDAEIAKQRKALALPSRSCEIAATDSQES